MKHRTALPALIALFALSTHAHADNSCPAGKTLYHPGLWEVTTTTQSSMMPKPMNNTIRHCVTQQDAENACNNMGNMTGGKNQACKVSDFKLVGNHATWNMTCSNPQFSAQGHGESTFQQDSYSGSFDITANMPQGMSMQTTSTFKGQRVGDCSQ